MKSRDALKTLAELSTSQWGMVTSAQARARGVSHMNLTRLTDAGDLVRLSHGVYKNAGAPGGEHDELRAAWLASEPKRLAWDRIQDKPAKVVVSGESAAVVHGLGGLRAMRSEFTTPSRKQTQRPDVQYRTRNLCIDDVTVREGLPVTTPERTIADLVEQRTPFDHIGDVLRDAARKSRLDTDRLSRLLGPLAERNGHAKGDGDALLEELLEAARIDLRSLSKQVVRMPDLATLVVRDYLATIDVSAFFDAPALRSTLEDLAKRVAELVKAAGESVMPTLPVFEKLAESMVAATAVFDSAAMRSVLEVQEKQVAAPNIAGMEQILKALSSLGSTSATLGADSALKRLSEAIDTVDWASLIQHTKQIEMSDLVEDHS
ncbi:MAG: type IV toxin-antitoxin system AbiEi family antitoxin domain-containing protein [Propionibacteriaceae bacterium]|nr:type IV toxin-antitoxin system AbiEi family antitoxin domain-containing protein [Propionibacteriaceae bacterium]